MVRSKTLSQHSKRHTGLLI